jgi:subtilisin family serine protease
MRKIILIATLITLSFSNIFAENKDAKNYYKDRIYVKFRENSKAFNTWSQNNRQDISSLFLEYKNIQSIRPFISNAAFIGKSNSKNAIASARINSLQRIAIVNFSSEIDAFKASKEFEKYDFIEYAEPIPIAKFTAISDDPYVGDQYYLNTIKAPQAWATINSTDTILVAVVDTGVDIYHVDLAQNIFYNQGELGKDKNGNDKRTNGIDDDGNGYIDDYVGWDFCGDGQNIFSDNMPTPGNEHGTHVAGTIGAVTNNKIGVAGVAKNVKILPVKIGVDDTTAISVGNGYEGILYAAKMGAKIISCSWGSGGFSLTEKELMKTVDDMGALVVCATGNDSRETVNYPAAYPTAMSVSAVDADLKAAYFTNYSPKVDISAPGVRIMATLLGNSYGKLSGTSMATPIVSAVAAMTLLKHPEFTPNQLKAFLKYSSDTSLNSKNIATYKGRLGFGVVDAYSALTIDKAYAVDVNSYEITEFASNKFKLSVNLKNTLASIDSCDIQAELFQYTQVCANLSLNKKYIKNFESNSSISIDSLLNVELLNSAIYDIPLVVLVKITKDGRLLCQKTITFYVNQTYLNISQNNILTTANSRGNFAFNDYSNNYQGEGFIYKNSDNLLCEGALMISISDSTAYNCARSVDDEQSADFEIIDRIKLSNPSESETIAKTKYRIKDLEKNKIEIAQTIFASNKDENKDFIISEYALANNSATDYPKAYLGLFFDWDIRPNYYDDVVIYDENSHILYCRDSSDNNPIFLGVCLLTDQSINYKGILNSATGNAKAGEINWGIHDGFTSFEKWKALTGGLTANMLNKGDASEVIGGGPFELKSNSTTNVCFAIIAGNSIEELRDKAVKAKSYYDKKTNSVEKIIHESISISPNPIKYGADKIKVAVEAIDDFSIDIFNSLGERVKTFGFVAPQDREYYLNIDNMPIGSYYLRLTTKNGNVETKNFVICD